MINVTRGPEPDSLDSTIIRKYLQKLAAYQSLTDEEKITQSAPKCTYNYRKPDVLEAFDRDFYAKCYLTEQSYIHSDSMEVDHFKPKSAFPELTYSWENLYPADRDANSAKPRIYPADGYLDPCSPQDDVEKDIIYLIGFGEVSFTARDTNNLKAVNTARLLQKLHNGDTPESKKKTATLVHSITKRRDEILNLIIEWQDAQKNGNREKEAGYEQKLRNFLSRRSAFTMLMRSIEAVKKYIPSDFLD